ncbi:YcaO-like family protein [Amycolatopsis sp. cg5]|uniref:YcaO-like family protein n=1 Tax=Amycolatopsis sp. cg5 TaxID=3238802 RepID=UPI00352615E3
MRKVFFDGTHRVRRPEHTWALVEPLLPRFGVTRIADITGLDVIGVPVATSVRPLAKSLSVSQGKGRTPLLAKISAAMEAIELWHIEHVRGPVLFAGTPARELELGYAVTDLVTAPSALVTDATALDWAGATGLVTGRAVPVPSALVSFAGHSERRWSPPGLRSDSNGLASGNSLAEAALHALYEVIERDALSRYHEPESLDLTSIPDEGCQDLVDKVVSAGATLTVAPIPNRFGVPCFDARIWSPDFAIGCQGSGAHLDPAVALSRAITEAVQSRLTAIAGSRDDLPPIYHRVEIGAEEPPRPAERLVGWGGFGAEAAGPFEDLDTELAWIGKLTQQVTGFEPLVTDLSTRPEFAVVKVIVPGTVVDEERVHPSR